MAGLAGGPQLSAGALSPRSGTETGKGVEGGGELFPRRTGGLRSAQSFTESQLNPRDLERPPIDSWNVQGGLKEFGSPFVGSDQGLGAGYLQGEAGREPGYACFGQCRCVGRRGGELLRPYGSFDNIQTGAQNSGVAYSHCALSRHRTGIG